MLVNPARQDADAVDEEKFEFLQQPYIAQCTVVVGLLQARKRACCKQSNCPGDAHGCTISVVQIKTHML